MEFHQLRCFIAVVEEGGFNRATSRLHISQPALSYQIKQLEQELDTSLFHRRPGGVSTTEAGRVLAEHAREVLETVRQARCAIEGLADGVVGEVRIGTANSVGIYFLPRVLWAIQEKYPKARPTVLYRHSSEILELLGSNRLDLALVANPRPDRRLAQETVIEERISLVCGRAHPFFGKKVVRPSELEKCHFVFLSEKCSTGQLIRDYLSNLELNIEPIISTDNVETVKKMVEVGLGVAFLPDMVTAGEVASDGDTSGRFTRIAVGPPLARRIDLVTWQHFEKSRATEAIIQEIREHASEWKKSDIKCA